MSGALEPAAESPAADPRRHRGRAIALAAELALLAAFLVLYHAATDTRLYSNGRMFFPGPDGIEYGWFAFALNAGRSPMVVIAHEVHPSRYGPIHPLCMAAWMFLDGDGMESLLQYSEVAMMVGALGFWALLAGLGARPPTRMAALVIAFYSSLSIRLGRSLMPETTMCWALMLGAALAVWCAKFPMGAGWRRRAMLFVLAASGALCAVPGTIRPSLLPFCAIPLLAVRFSMEGGARRAALLAVLVGSTCTPLLTAVFNQVVMGYWGITAYSHWSSGVRFVDPRGILNPGAEFPHAPSTGDRLAEALSGRVPSLARTTWPALPVLWGLALFSVWRTRRVPSPPREHAWFPALAIVLFLGNLLFHLVYFFHDLRFHFLQFTLVAAAGMMGAERLLVFLCGSATGWVASLARISAAVGVFLMADVVHIPEDTLRAQVIARPPKVIAQEEIVMRNNRIAGRVIRDFHVPVFTRGLPVGGARALMGLVDHLHVPFCSLFRVRDYVGDSHLVQFHWHMVGPPSRLVVTGAPWDAIRAHEAWLIDPGDGALNEDFARALVARHGAFIVYYQYGVHEQVVPLLEWSKAQGWPVTNLKPYHSFGLYLVGIPKGQAPGGRACDSRIDAAGAPWSMPGMNDRDQRPFKLVSGFQPAGDQPQAIRALLQGLSNGLPAQTLLGVTGSGKTFTLANVVEAWNKPTLVLAPNKTLAAQLYREFKEFFPENAVEYFVSYYDYYQPEAYIPSTDTYIEKDSSINDELDKLRLSATRSLLERTDTLVVASVSCIYGIGSPAQFNMMVLLLQAGARMRREDLLKRLVALQYTRNDVDFHRGTFRVRGDQVDVFPAYEERKGLRISLFGDEIEHVQEFDSITGERGRKFLRAAIYPASVYVTDRPSLERAAKAITEELAARVAEFERQHKFIEAQRIRERTERDLDMMRETGTCLGIENYSRHIAGRNEGDRPDVLLDYFPGDFLLIVDESHIAVPQVRAMYAGDRSRKQTLVDFGFRLPSALDNRPLKFEEWESLIHQVIFVSATPEQYELARSEGVVVEQVVRPTGLVDPEIEVRPTATQVQDLLAEIRKVVAQGQRVLATTLTKRFSEELTDYLSDLGVKCRYMHSDIEVLERVAILRDLRLGKFDVLIGINLLREGLDLPEVALVAILDADKEGYLRSTRSLIQTVGRAARNAAGRVIMYADTVTESMRRCIDETNRRREKQVAYNTEHGITPRSVEKRVSIAIETEDTVEEDALLVAEEEAPYRTAAERERLIGELRKAMKAAASALEFERAGEIRDRIRKLEAEGAR